MKKYLTIALLFATIISEAQLQPLVVSANKRYLQTGDGNPFFWLGDTGWLLFKKCNRAEVVQYLDDRKEKGFNVIQAMLLHAITVTDAYGDSALLNRDVSTPAITAGNDFNKKEEYDYWDHVDYVVGEAAKRGIYMALVPVWGSNIKKISVEQAKKYAGFLAERYKNKSNIIWLNGGDIRGGEALDKWNAIGNTLRLLDPNHLITFHPRGRNSSSAWFHHAPWLDFNMFQSGHRNYAQDTLADEKPHYGEDNWRYVKDDYEMRPTKPTLDGEPSYENIPYGLHYSTEPYWKDYEIRRYAYWSVFAGACGFTYGNNEVMQFYNAGEKGGAYFPKNGWKEGLQKPGASQMQYLKNLLLSKAYFDRVPDQSLVMNNGEKYSRVLATRGTDYALFYVYNGRTFKVNCAKLNWNSSDVYWYSPRDGSRKPIYKAGRNGVKDFNPPGEQKNGNDWVLIIEKTVAK